MPLSLYEALVPDRGSKPTVREALPSRRKALTRIIKEVCVYRRNNPLPDPPRPALTRNSFFQFHGPYSTTERLQADRIHTYHPPPPLPLKVQRPLGKGATGDKRAHLTPPQQVSRKGAHHSDVRQQTTPPKGRRQQMSITSFLWPH